MDTEEAILFNPSAVKAVDYNPKRDKFFEELAATVDISEMISKYTKVSFSRKAYMKIRSLLGRVKRKVIDRGRKLFLIGSS